MDDERLKERGSRIRRMMNEWMMGGGVEGREGGRSEGVE